MTDPGISPPAPKDRTGAARARRFRQNRKAQKEADAIAAAMAPGVEISTAEMVEVAIRLVNGTAKRRDALTAAALVMHLFKLTPHDGAVRVSLDR